VKPLDTLLDEVMTLKEVERAGWARVGVVEAESVAAHSWGVAMLGLLFCPPELDRGRVVLLALLHDLAEATVGDITPFDGISREEKARRERIAAARLFAGRPPLWALWEDYEQNRSPEAHFVHQLDKLDMLVQAQRYRSTQGVNTAQFVESALRGIDHPALGAALAALCPDGLSLDEERTVERGVVQK
jgi:putative hydrolase of HD superfamily